MTRMANTTEPTTRAHRREHIARALKQRAERPGGETYRLPLRGTTVVEVIDVPLELPVLNAESFRIAPQLLEHPQAALVEDDPDSAAAQAVVAALVRQVHRAADELKENLQDEGQAQPGVVTRDGRLINANTRCVLLRELVREGRTSARTLRVAVLPGDIGNTELLELELALQNQKELKDEYSLISSLLMVRKLHDNGLNDAQIARGLRLKPADVRRRREMLVLIDRARRLVEPPLPRTAFIAEKDQYENWEELLGEVRKRDLQQGAAAGDRHIRGWLVAYLSGVTSVHKLRGVTDDWAETDLLPALADGVPDVVARSDNELPFQPPQADPDGLSLLGDDTSGLPETDDALRRLLDLTAAARIAGAAPIDLPDGASRSGSEVTAEVQRHVVRALDARKRRAAAGSRLTRPLVALGKARDSLNDALDAIGDVATDPAFRRTAADAVVTAAEVARLAERVETALRSVPDDDDRVDEA